MLQCTFCTRRISHITSQEISRGWGITTITCVSPHRPITLIHCPDHGVDYIQRIFGLTSRPSPTTNLSILKEPTHA